VILLKQSRNGIHHRNASLLFFLRFLSHKTPRVHGVSLEGPTRAQLWADLEVNSQTKRGRKRKRQRGRGQREREREVILPFLCSPGWSLHPGPQRGAEYTSPPQWRGPTGAVAIWTCVCVCVWCSFKQAFEWPNCVGIPRPESGLGWRRAAGGRAAAPRQPHSAKEPRHNAHN